jgi:hypothetical protein
MEMYNINTKKIVSLTLALIMVVSASTLLVASAETPPTLAWVKHYGGEGGSDYAQSVIQTSDGGYLAVGESYAYGSVGYVVKTDIAGNMVWNKTYGSGCINTAIQLSDDSYVLAGSSGGPGNELGWLLKIDSSGNQIWSKTWGRYVSTTRAYDLIQTSDGGFAFVGHTNAEGAGSSDGYLVKTNSVDIMRSLIQTSEGGYVLTGKLNTGSGGSAANDRIWLVRTNSQGVQQWSETYTTSSSGAYKVISITDGFAVIGIANLQPNYYLWGEACLLTTDTSGVQQFFNTYSQITGAAWLTGIQTSDGGYALGGTTGYVGAIVKTDDSGNIQWTQTLSNSETPSFGNSDSITDIIQTTDGSYVVTGMIYQTFSIVDIELAKFVVPEYGYGALLAAVSCFAGLAIFNVNKKRQQKN